MIRQWVLKYNGHEKLKASGTGGNAVMTKGRKATFDERVEIVQYCIAHDPNYAKTSEQFGISYNLLLSYLHLGLSAIILCCTFIKASLSIIASCTFYIRNILKAPSFFSCRPVKKSGV